MIDPPQVVTTTATHAAIIPVVVPREQIRKAMSDAIGELMAAVAAQRVKPTGPLFSRHMRMDPAVFDFEVGLPVPGPIAAAGRMVPGQLPAIVVARTVYRGPYEKLGQAWGELNDWLKAEGHRPGPGLWESYLAGPGSISDPADFRTELNRPLLP